MFKYLLSSPMKLDEDHINKIKEQFKESIIVIKMNEILADNISYLEDKELLETKLKPIDGYINVTLEDSNGQINLSPSDQITIALCFINAIEGS